MYPKSLAPCQRFFAKKGAFFGTKEIQPRIFSESLKTAKMNVFSVRLPACSCSQNIMAVERRNPKPPQPERWLPVLLFGLVLGTFLPCLRDGFVRIDDPLYVLNNPHVRQGMTWASLRWACTSADAQNWHPLTWLSLMLDSQCFGLSAAAFHATNIFLHAANTALLFLLLRAMTGARGRSFVAAALFGLHPLRVESVAWISERKDVLSALFWMLAIWAYARYANKFKVQGSKFKVFYGLSLLCFVLGLLAKPMLVTLPFALLLLDYWPLRRWGKIPVQWLLLEKIPFLVLAAASSAVTFIVQRQGGAITPADELGLSLRLDNAIVSYARYLGKTAWPVDLCAMYPHPGHLPPGTVAGAGLILAVVTALSLWRWRAMPYLAVGWFWFLGTLVPVIGLVQVGRQGMADRYTYIPSIGLVIAVVWAVAKLAQPWKKGNLFAGAAAAAAIVVCIPLTVRQIGYWKDSTTLFGHSVKVNPSDWISSAYLAFELQADGKADQAIAMYQQSLQVNPYRPEVRFKLANFLLERHRFDDALAQFRTGVSLDPDDIDLRQGLGAALQDMGRLDEAIEQFNQVIRLNPNDADAYSNLGNCYGMKGRPDDAIRCFEQAVKLKPKSAQNRRELGVGLANKGRWDEAIAQFQEALQLDPADAQARRLLQSALQDKSKTAPPPRN
jgi:protein O-mannosyl-transferase